MTQIISSQSLADIKSDAPSIEISLEGRGHRAGLSHTAKQTLRAIGALKTFLGEGAQDFRLVLEQHQPTSGFILSGDDCGNSWHIEGLYAPNPKLHHLESLLHATGVAPVNSNGTSVTYDANRLNMVLEALASCTQQRRA